MDACNVRFSFWKTSVKEIDKRSNKKLTLPAMRIMRESTKSFWILIRIRNLGISGRVLFLCLKRTAVIPGHLPSRRLLMNIGLRSLSLMNG